MVNGEGHVLWVGGSLLEMHECDKSGLNRLSHVRT
jgi:hypothetical protein